jgi:Family of unknown function (DUF5681)
MDDDAIRAAADRAEVASAKTTGQQRRHGFQPGQSGNPAGRPAGSRHKASEMVEILMSGDADAVTKAVIAKALDGDMTAARLVLERIAPPRKGRAITLDLPPIANVADLATAQNVVVGAMADGSITTDEAADVAKVLEAAGASIERRTLEQRIAALEQQGTLK